MAIKLDELPNEVIYQILLYVPPAAVPNVQQVSRQFNDLSQPILWRHHCRTQFKYWNSIHDIQQKLSGAVATVDWKSLFSVRHGIDRDTTREVDSILATQVGRIQKTENIVMHCHDAKDTLIRHLNTGDEVADVLARRFYSDAILGNLHRKSAIREWVKIRDGESVPLERALAAFDMFILHGRKGDFEEVSDLLDRIAEQIRKSSPDFETQPPRRRAIVLSTYLLEKGLVGVNGNAHYHDLQNNFIGIALQNASHPSLPLVSVAIFCGLAGRLGMNAQPCGFPFHVLAIITPPLGRTLDGEETEPGQESSPMYMDPFRSSQETDVQDMKTQLLNMGVAASDYADFLGTSTTEEIVRRCAKNIITSIQRLPRQNGAGPMSTVQSFPEMDGALYAALWSLSVLPEDDQGAATTQRTRYLYFIAEKVQIQYPMDVGLMEEHIVPFITQLNLRESLNDTIRVIRTGDNMPKQVKYRDQDTDQKVQHNIGQVFLHKRYHYQAVITGWDVECAAGDMWIQQMNVHSLSRGQHQSFYHVLVDDKSVRYVAEENIERLNLEPDPGLMALAGQHFKRWDRASMKFVSNVKDEYPDD